MALGDTIVGANGGVADPSQRAASHVRDLWEVGILVETMSVHHLPDHSSTLLVDSCLQLFLEIY